MPKRGLLTWARRGSNWSGAARTGRCRYLGNAGLRPGLDPTHRPVPFCPALDRADAEDLLIIAGLHLVTPTLWSGLRSVRPDRPASGRPRRIPGSHVRPERAPEPPAARAGPSASRPALGTAGIRPVFLKGLAALLQPTCTATPRHASSGTSTSSSDPTSWRTPPGALQRAGYQRLPDGVPHRTRPCAAGTRRPPGDGGTAPIPGSRWRSRRSPLNRRHDPARPSGLGGAGALALVPCPDDLVVHNVAHAMLQEPLLPARPASPARRPSISRSLPTASPEPSTGRPSERRLAYGAGRRRCARSSMPTAIDAGLPGCPPLRRSDSARVAALHPRPDGGGVTAGHRRR